MRLKLVLKIVEGTVVPCNYMYELSSCLYKVLNEGNPVFTAWLHDKGYCKEKKAFKLFTMWRNAKRPSDADLQKELDLLFK